MEVAVEEVAAPPGRNEDPSPITKGKRTKRHRPHSPIPFTISSAASVAAAAASEESTTTEEEDTAHCLILLARGHFFTRPPPTPEKSTDDYPHQYFKKPTTSKRSYSAALSPTTPNSAGRTGCATTVIYPCKTCNRIFNSFQALGGHRASHKKPKNEKKSFFNPDHEDLESPPYRNKPPPPNPISDQLRNSSASSPKPPPSSRIHECSYCGAEFTSGQALGGHMRRHRAGPISSPSYSPPLAAATVEKTEREESKEQKIGLSLDLNLPAPSEDDNQKFGLSDCDRANQSPERRQQQQQQNDAAAERLVLSTSSNPTRPLVDCHY